MKMSELGKVKLNVSQTGSGAKPPAAGRIFVVFCFGKKAILVPLDHISHMFSAI